MTARVYRLISCSEWKEAQTAGSDAPLPWSDDDRRDGFFHLSARDQVAETARRHYAHVEDLWALELDEAALAEKLAWEPSRGGALFPHFYGEAPVSAVTAAKPFDPRDFG
jgi:uncharacterized protein (DUF952 family)